MTNTRREFLKIFGLGTVAAGTLPLGSIIASTKQATIIPQVLDLGGEKSRWIPQPPVVKKPPQFTTEKFLESFDAIFKGNLQNHDLSNDITSIFERTLIDTEMITEFPTINSLSGSDAYAIGLGDEIERFVDSDYITVPTNKYYNSVSILEHYLRDKRYDIIIRAIQILQQGLKQKLWISGWELLLASGVDRDILVFDGNILDFNSDAPKGRLTTRLVSLMKTIMRREGGGTGKLTDLYVSPIVISDFNNNLEFVKTLTIHNVNIHTVDELGIDQKLHKYYKDSLGGTLWSGRELVVGLDKSRSSFFMCETKEPTYHHFVKNGRV